MRMFDLSDIYQGVAYMKYYRMCRLHGPCVLLVCFVIETGALNRACVAQEQTNKNDFVADYGELHRQNSPVAACRGG